MIYLLEWWFLLLLVGIAALPVTLRFLRFLPDRGYAFAKPLGLLLWVYPFWLLAVFGFVQNSFGVLAFMLGLVAVASWVALRGKGEESVLAWLRAHWRYVLVVEIVFAVALAAFAYFRAFNPEISGTEKPMEFMFLNSILSSANFPPRDAWLAGYSISYYYLGYVIVAALAKLGNVPSSYAFNLGLIMTYALAALGAFGLIFNLVKHTVTSGASENAKPARGAPYVFGVLAVFMLLVIGNLQGAVEVAYNGNIGSREFYRTLDLHGLADVTPSGTFLPEDYWWWWRASRVVNDHNPADGGAIEVIDEFPAFSFLLGDLHPHVLALPFGLLALAIALALMLKPQSAIENRDGLQRALLTPRTLLIALIVGALGMLNTWDIVTYGLVIAAAFAISQYRAAGRVSNWVLISSVVFLLTIYVGGYLLFLPFFMGFASQARGIAPNIFSRTPIPQYLIMWGMFVFVLAVFLGVLFSQVKSKGQAIVEWVQFAIPLLLVPVFIALVGALVLTVSPTLRDLLSSALRINPENAVFGVLSQYGLSFVASPWTFLLLVVLIAGVAAFGRLELLGAQGGTVRTGVVFALLLALVGFLLTFGVEFLYIRDTFETRMNTVFKLYYQAWLLLSMAATFGAFYIWHTTRGVGRGVWVAAFSIMFGLSLIYPALAYPNRAGDFVVRPEQGIPTLDGWAWVQSSNPDDYAAIQWVRQNVPPTATILEAAGSQYSFDDRVSVATGIPTVLGWGGHELQWRGNADASRPREGAIEEIYKSRNLKRTRELLREYGVDYVILGDIEKNKYQLNASQVDKFETLGKKVFEQGGMQIFDVGQVSVSLDTP